MKSIELVHYLDTFLRINEIQDYPTALNGLQVEGTRDINRIALAVDASQATIEAAIEGQADMLIVHHGLFWDGNLPVVGRRYKRLKPLLDSGVALYSSHLPLDVHPTVGNNAVIARELGIEVQGTFGSHKGTPMGVWGEIDLPRGELVLALERVLQGDVHLVRGGPDHVKRVGIVSGGAASMTLEAASAGLDAFITGEGTHHNHFDAEEGGINLLLGGHYATETFGVKALGEHLVDKFALDSFFIDRPTGL